MLNREHTIERHHMAHPHETERQVPSQNQQPYLRCVERCVEAGRRNFCTSSAALMAISPTDVLHMSMTEQRIAQFRAMFDRTSLHTLFVGIVPHPGEWCPRRSADFMPVGDWLADGACRVADSRGELVKVNPFTGFNESGGSDWHRLVTGKTIAEFTHILMVFDGMSLSEQCAFWYGAIKMCRLPVVALVDSGCGLIHGVVRVDCEDREEFNLAVARARQVFASSPIPAMRTSIELLQSPTASIRLAGCVCTNTYRVQRLLYLSEFESVVGKKAPTSPPPRRGALVATASRSDSRAPEAHPGLCQTHATPASPHLRHGKPQRRPLLHGGERWQGPRGHATRGECGQ